MPVKKVNLKNDKKVANDKEKFLQFLFSEEVKNQLLGFLLTHFTPKKETLEILNELKQMRISFDERFKEQDRRFNALADELKQLRISADKRFEEHSKRIEELSKRIEEHSKRIEELSKRVEEHSKRIEEQGKQIEGHSKRIDKLTNTLGAIGARWGIMSEKGFRNALKELLEEEFNVNVNSWSFFDKDGEVFSQPAQVDIDIAIKNQTHILIEIKAATSAADVSTFHRKTLLYRKINNPPEVKKIIVTPYIDENARSLAEKLQITVYTHYFY